jgi:hypothetical protein
MKTPNLVSSRRAFLGLTAVCAALSSCTVQAQPILGGFVPDGSVLFQPTNQFVFTVASSAPGGIDASNIQVTLIGTNLFWKQDSSLTLSNGAGLTVSGTPSSRVVTSSTPLTSNLQYTASIQVTDSSGTLLSTNTFDTITPIYTWECEDWDYSSGQFLDNPQTNAYAQLAGVPGVDANNTQGGGTAYRSNDTGDLGNEVNGDTKRTQYVAGGLSDYDIGWTAAGNWANYTRTYPTGLFNVVLRAAGNTGGPDRASLWLLTGGLGTTNQTRVRLGQFDVPNTANWQIYAWSTLVDSGGNPVIVTNTGKVITYQMAQDNGGFNANFFMLVPANLAFKAVPSVTAVSPSSSQMFATNNVFTFTVNSVPGISSTGVVVTANGIKPYGLTFGGSPHQLVGTFPLATPNVPYTVNINLTDANGSSSYSTAFATYSASNYTWECEDWDYTNGAGKSAQFFDNPQVDAYAGLSGNDGVDAHNASGGNSNYRPNVGGLGNEPNGDIQRAQFAGTNDYDIGWTAAGQWANYTRTYPTGVFNVVFRAAGNSGGNNVAALLRVTGGVGTPTQTTVPLGQFNVPNTGGWQTYAWAPMVDSTGSPAFLTNNGSVATLQLYENGGGWNGNFFMLVQPDTTRPKISRLYPDGSVLFQPTNTLSFVVNSALPINTNLISVTLNGAASNVGITGSPTNLTVTVNGLQPNTTYNTVVGVNTTNNNGAVVSYTFDTYSPTNYTWEAEDWDYNGGSFLDNPALNSYSSFSGIDGIDAHNLDTGNNSAYRTEDSGNLGNEINGDTKRRQYVTASTNDFDIGWTAAGQWANYTRSYPTGTYNVFLRASSPTGQADGASLWRVTSGGGTTNQTLTRLGVFNMLLTGGYQTYAYVPLMDTNGNMVTISNTGAPTILRFNEDSGGWNANFFMLVPATPVAGRPALSIGLVNGKATITFTGTLQSSGTVTGQYQDVPGATSPYTPPTPGTDTFYRSRQ